MKHLTLTLAATAMTMAIGGQSIAADQVKDRVQTETQTQTQSQLQVQDQERIYGSQLMTEQERNEYRNQMRALKTEQEREAFRKEHHEKMKVRAKAQGAALPDEPPAQGKGMGPGLGQGQGMKSKAGGGGYGGGRK